MEQALEQVKSRAKALVERVRARVPPLTPETRQKLVRLDMFPKVPVSATEKRPSTGIRLSSHSPPHKPSVFSVRVLTSDAHVRL